MKNNHGAEIDDEVFLSEEEDSTAAESSIDEQNTLKNTDATTVILLLFHLLFKRFCKNLEINFDSSLRVKILIYHFCNNICECNLFLFLLFVNI